MLPRYARDSDHTKANAGFAFLMPRHAPSSESAAHVFRPQFHDTMERRADTEAGIRKGQRAKPQSKGAADRQRVRKK